MTVQVTWDSDAPKTGLPDEGSDTKTYPPTPATASVEVEREPVGSGPVLDGPFSVPLIVVPSASTVAAGETITVDGSGLAASTSGTLALVAGPPGTTGGDTIVSVPVTADATGAIAQASVEVPEGTADGEYHLVLSGGVVVIDNVSITVGSTPPPEPTITADKDTVDSSGDEAERTVTVTLTGFPADASGRVAIMQGDTELPGGVDVTVGSDGASAPTPLVVPAGQAAGDYTIRAAFADVTVDDVPLTVTGADPVPTLVLTPTSVEAGSATMASGSGFPASAEVTITATQAETEVGTATATADDSGAFADVELTIAATATAGEASVVATAGEVSSEPVTLTVTVAPEPEPLAAPANVSAGTPTATEIPLTWDEVADATAYRIESSTDGETWTADATEPITNAGSATGLTAATEYQLRVTALGDGTTHADSPPSETVTATTAAARAARKRS